MPSILTRIVRLFSVIGMFVFPAVMSTAQVGVVNIDLEGAGAADVTHVGANGIYSTTGTVWNSIDTSVTANSLLDEFGVSTGIGIRLGSSGPFPPGVTDPNATNHLQDSGFFIGSIEITGLLLGHTYNLSGYIMHNSGFGVTDATGFVDFKGRGRPTYNLPGEESMRVLPTPPGDYVRFEGLVPADLGSDVYGISINGDGGITAFQLRGELPGPLITGDYDSSGEVGQGDLELVLQFWGQSVLDEESIAELWTNTTGVTAPIIGQDELALVLQNWGNVSTDLAAIADATGLSEEEVRGLIPEPGTAMVLGLIGPMLLRRRAA